jgi:regulator of replication initiation timing
VEVQYSRAVPGLSTNSGVGAVAIWTSADQPGLGDQLPGRVIQQELLARLPGWRMSLYATDGWRRSTVADGGLVTEPLRDRTPAELAEAATLTVVCSSDRFALDLATRLDATHPVVPFTVPEVSANLAARAALVVSGPHPGLLLDRVIDRDTLPARVAQLRQLGELPDGGYEVAPGKVEQSPNLVFEDRLAILSGARAVVTDDVHTAAACAWLGVDCHRPDGTTFTFAPVTELKAQLDRVAELAEHTLAAQGGDLTTRMSVLAEENHALRQAHWHLRERMLEERRRLAEPLAEAWQERNAAVDEAAEVRTRNDELARRNDELAVRLAHVEQELENWQNTKLVRWTRPLRDAYGRTRG